MNSCNDCHEFQNKGNNTSKINLQRSFTKINGKLHLGFDSPIVCPTVTDYVPDTIILAGNGAIENKDGEDCWTILKNQMKK